MLVALMIALMVLPTPAPSLRFAVWTVAKLIVFSGLGVVLMLPLHSHQIFGLALVALILFVTFYLQAEGRIAGLNAIFVIIGVTLVPAFGQDNMDVGVEFAKGLSQSALALFPVIWIAFAMLPAGVFAGPAQCPRVEGTSADRGILALRPGGGADADVRLHAGQRQQHPLPDRLLPARHDRAARESRDGAQAGRRPVYLHPDRRHGGPGHVVAHEAVAIVVLVRADDGAVHVLFCPEDLCQWAAPLTPNYYRWSNGLSTLVFIVFPDALTQGFTGDDPNMKFYQRILDYALVTSYSVIAVLVFDGIVERLRAWRRRATRNAS